VSSGFDARNRSSTSVRRVSRKVLIFCFSSALLVAVCIALVLGLQLRIYFKDVQTLSASLALRTQEVVQLKETITEMNNEVASLVESKFPHLTALSLDQVISIDKDYVKNIVFTVAGRNEEKQYEYKIVFENRTNGSLEPNVFILFYDRVGMQLGVSEPVLNGDKERISTVLESQEIKSYLGMIEVTDGEKPAYFMIRFNQ